MISLLFAISYKIDACVEDNLEFAVLFYQYFHKNEGLYEGVIVCIVSETVMVFCGHVSQCLCYDTSIH